MTVKCVKFFEPSSDDAQPRTPMKAAEFWTVDHFQLAAEVFATAQHAGADSCTSGVRPLSRWLR